jgi:hypothetical protein
MTLAFTASDADHRTGRRTSWTLAAVGVAVVASALAARAASAASEDTLLKAASVLHYVNAMHAETADTVFVNGLRFGVSAGSTTDSLARTADYFESVCRSENDAFAAALNAMPRAPQGLARNRNPHVGVAPVEPATVGGVLRLEGGANGERTLIACLDTSAHRVGPATLATRVKAFLDTGDLAELGDLRLVLLERSAATVTYVAVWSDGTLPLLRAFPPRGDAPGKDPPLVPRPNNAERRFSAWSPGTSGAIAVYALDGRDPSVAASEYREALSREGWHVETGAGNRENVTARRDGRTVITAPSVRDGHAVLTVLAF